MTERRSDEDTLESYAAAFRRAAEVTDRQVASFLQEVDRAAALLLEILGQPEEGRRGLVEGEVRFHSLKLCELLLARSREAWFRSPQEAVELARLAVVLADRLDIEHYGKSLVETIRASAWAHLGNALRIASDLRQAEAAFRTAEEHLDLGGGDPFTEAQILNFKSSLRIAQGEFEEAARLLDRTVAIYREARDRHREGRSLIQMGNALAYTGQFREAIRLIRSGLRRIDLEQEPRLHVTAHHSLIWSLNETGCGEEALERLETTRRLYLDLGEPTNLLRLRWLEGVIARDLGRLDEAEAALKDARAGFIERDLGIDAALVSLDLAEVYAGRGQTAEMKRLATEMVPIFESRDVHSGAIAALAVFQKAAEAEAVTTELLGEVAEFLRRARFNPGLRFEPAG